jgi:hypothetical protein
LLRAGAGAAALSTLGLAGCTDQVEPAPPDPDRVALEQALAVEASLLAVLSAWEDGGATALDAVEVVDQHVQVLRAALGASPSPSPTEPSPPSQPSPTEPSAADPSTADVQRGIDDAADAHSAALRTASAGVSPLLASLAASDAALAAWLRSPR